ncbi:MAG: DUF4214 domain-containing protein, partial [Methylobacteriaceae bacterium]|nr:DUF4214 domain-containing protein [Methylobacteriaceae bacterium]
AFDHFETTIVSPNDTIADTSWVANHNGAPDYRQTRSQTFNPDGSETVTVSDFSAAGILQDRIVTTTSANGLSVVSAIDSTGSGTADEIRSDVTVLNSDGSRTETIRQAAAGASLAAGETQFERVITTSADGRTITTQIDNDGNGVFEQTDRIVIAADGSRTETVTYTNNFSGQGTWIIASDGSRASDVVETTSANGLVRTVSEGDITATTTMFADANGSYQWVQTSPTSSANASASHLIDVNKVDAWTSTVGSQTQTIRIDTATETKDIGLATGIYIAAFGRSMRDDETQSLVKYISGGVLDQARLANDLLSSTEYIDKIGDLSDVAFVARTYENAFGHAPPATDVGAYMTNLANGAMSRADVVDAIAQKAEDESAGNGLLQLLPGAPASTPGAVSLISNDVQDLLDIGAVYENFVSSFPVPGGDLTSGELGSFLDFAQGPGSGAATYQTVNFASVATGSSGTILNSLFGGPLEPGAVAPPPPPPPPPPPSPPGGGNGPGHGGPVGGPDDGGGGGGSEPLVLNLSGHMVHTTDLRTSSVQFDYTGSGTQSTTAWITPDEGFLVLDPNKVHITNGTCLIPTFAALAAYDANGDGTLTAAEADAAGVMVWVDANGDGKGEPAELKTLDELGIASINLAARQTGTYDNGNIIARDSTFTWANGQTGDIADAWLMYNGALQNETAYQFSDSVVTRAADGTASELVHGSHQTVQSGIGLSKIVDLGSHNTLEAGDTPNVTVSGGAGDTVIGGAGHDTLLALGDDEEVSTGSGTSSVLASGNHVTIDASHGASTISLSGADETVTGTSSSTSIDVSGARANILGTGASITVEADSSAVVSGSHDSVIVAGNSGITLDASDSTLNIDSQATIVVNGASDAVTAGDGASLTIGGTGDVVTVTDGFLTLEPGASATIEGKSNIVSQEAASSLTMVGQSAVVDVRGAGATDTISAGLLLVESGASATVTGNHNSIENGSSGALAVTGDGNTIASSTPGADIAATGANDTVSIIGAGNAVTGDGLDVELAADTSASLHGSETNIVEKGGDAVTVAGAGDTLVVSGTGNRATGDDLSAELVAGATLTLAGHHNALALAAGASPTFSGSVVIIAQDGDATLVAGPGDDTLVSADAFNSGDDTVVYSSADGNLTIADHADSAFSNTLQLVDLNAGDLTFSRSGNDLLINVNATGKVITVSGEFLSTDSDGIQQVRFADGTVWNRAQLATAEVYAAGAGDVTVTAPDGNAILVAGPGNDTLVGGDWFNQGNDTFLYGSSNGNLRIEAHTFSAVSDTLQLSDLNAGDVTLSASGSDLVVTVNTTGRTITIAGNFNSADR